LRRRGSVGDAIVRAGIATAGLLGLVQWFHVVSSRVASLYDPDPSLPGSLQYPVPAVDVVWTAARGGFAIAALAAAAALALRSNFFRRTTGRVMGLAAIGVALLPTDLRSVGGLIADYLPGLLIAAWLALCAFFLLRDHVAAWALFGLFAFGGREALELLAQPAPADRAAGLLALLLLGAVAVAMLAGRRDVPAGVAPVPQPGHISTY
jgi:hypothetical protein